MLLISFSKLSTKELAYLGEQTITLSERNSNQEVTSNPVFALLKTKHGTYHEQVMRQTYSGMGPDVQGDDFLRDNQHGGVRQIVRGFARFENSVKCKPAQLLQTYFNETGSINKLNYANESIVLDKLIEKFSTDEGKAAIATLGIKEEVDMFVQSHNNFKNRYTDQVDANSELRQQPSASTLRKEMENVLRGYFSLVSTMKNVNPWKDIYSDLNELLKKF